MQSSVRNRRNPYYQGIRSSFRQKRVVEKFGDRNVATMKGKKSWSSCHDLYNTLVYKVGIMKGHVTDHTENVP